MKRTSTHVGTALTLALAFGAGCQTSTAPVEVPPEHLALQEVGEMCRVYLADNKRPPRTGKDLNKYAPAFNYGSMAIQDGSVQVFWGADLQPDSKAILAYEKRVPESGGKVLLQDGETVKEMTAQEFQAAPKAGK